MLAIANVGKAIPGNKERERIRGGDLPEYPASGVQYLMRAYESIFSYALLAVLGIVIAIASWTYPMESRYFPLAVGIAVALLAVIGIVRISHEPSGSTSDDDAPLLRATIGLIIFAAYLVAINYVGFLTGALIFLPALAVYGQVRKPLLLLGSSVGFVLVMHIVFAEIFSRPLPPDVIFGYLR